MFKPIKYILTLSMLVLAGQMNAAEPVKGDANGDGKTDAADLSAIADYILNQKTENFYVSAADVNGDGIVSVSDLSALVEVIYSTQLSEGGDDSENKDPKAE